MHDLGSADAEEDSQNFEAGYLLRQGRVKAGATLLNKAKVKSGREGDRLDVVTGVIRIAEFGIISGNGSMLPGFHALDCILEVLTGIRDGCAWVAGDRAGI